MLTVVSYDIREDRRRARVAKVLLDFGARVQFSVFECRLEAAQVERLARRLGAVIDEQEDSVRIYRICQECAPKVMILGTGVVTEDPEVYVI
ncbi:MAG TPA: CRISPR-associated endonuclease Cas2 [Thermoanaerobaculia bacterium]